MEEAQRLSNDESKRIFMKLELVYGKRFRENWPDIPMQAVMADWAEELGAFAGDGEAIGYALAHLPTTFPPTVLEFKELCQSAVNARERERDEQLRREYERLLTPDGMEWVWVPVDGGMAKKLLPEGSGYSTASVPDAVRRRAMLAMEEREGLSDCQRAKLRLVV